MGQGLPRRRSARRTTTPPSSQDVANRFAASALLYGSPALIPIPDLKRTRLPADGRRQPVRLARQRAHRAAGQGAAPRDRRARRPRRRRRPAPHRDRARTSSTSPSAPTPTPGCCCRCCTCSFDEGLADEAALARQTAGLGDAGARPSRGVPARGDRGAHRRRRRRRARRWRATSRAADGAAVYGRTGSCLGRFGTLVAFLIDAAQRRRPATSTAPAARCSGGRRSRSTRSPSRPGSTPTASERSRIGDFPDVLGALPASLMARGDDDAGRAARSARFFISAGNPVLSVPERRRARGGARAARPLWSRSTSTSTRPTATPTTSCRRPRGSSATTCRSPSSASTRPRSCSTPTPSSRRAARRARSGRSSTRSRGAIGVAPYSQPALRRAGASSACRMTPQRLARPAAAHRPDGDCFGLRPRGLSSSGCAAPARRGHVGRRSPTGVLREPRAPRTGARCTWIRRRSRGELAPPGAAGQRRTTPSFPLRLIGLRELRSHNSWMHNAPLLMRGGRDARRCACTPTTPSALGLDDGGARASPRRPASRRGAGARHRRGHARASSRCRTAGATAAAGSVANAAGGVNVNLLAVRRARGPRAARRHGLPQRRSRCASSRSRPRRPHRLPEPPPRQRHRRGQRRRRRSASASSKISAQRVADAAHARAGARRGRSRSGSSSTAMLMIPPALATKSGAHRIAARAQQVGDARRRRAGCWPRRRSRRSAAAGRSRGRARRRARRARARRRRRSARRPASVQRAPSSLATVALGRVDVGDDELRAGLGAAAWRAAQPTWPRPTHGDRAAAQRRRCRRRARTVTSIAASTPSAV